MSHAAMPGLQGSLSRSDGPASHLVACSISRRVRERLDNRPLAAWVLAVFDRACTLASDDGPVVALVLPELGNGPLNILVGGLPGVFATIEAGTPAWTEGTRLRVGELTAELAGAAVWEPHPNWELLRAQRRAIVGSLPLLEHLARNHAPPGSLLALENNPAFHRSQPGAALERATLSAYQLAVIELCAGWRGDQTRLQSGAAQLAGLGAGLTPAGDDLLAGLMLWAWLAHPEPRAFCHEVVHIAAPRTTTLSAAFLHAAASGECSMAWHRLLVALGKGETDGLGASVQDLLAYGATSGADALAGFLLVPRATQLRTDDRWCVPFA